MDAREDPPDERLVLLSKDGDLQAFNRLVERHERAVYNLCLRLLGNREAAEDAAQEAFLSAYRALPRFAGGNFRSWLLRIAANQSKDELRRRRRKDQAGSLDEIFGTTELPLEAQGEGEAGSVRVERLELAAALQQALLQLSFDHRQVIVLADVYEYSYEEIAEATGASLGTVKSRIHRAREKLRRIVEARPEQFGRERRLEG